MRVDSPGLGRDSTYAPISPYIAAYNIHTHNNPLSATTMEAIPRPYPITPRTSHVRTSSQPQASRATPTTSQQAATRLMQQADAQQPPLSAPASQESFASAQSVGSSNGTRGLQSSSSNVSQLTNYSSDLTSPKSNGGVLTGAYEDGLYAVGARSEFARRRTPEEGGVQRVNGGHGLGASPMSVVSPASTNGAKRTASGHVKNAPSLPNTPLTTTTVSGHRSRTDSISSTGSKAGELAANLKTRLGYAMVKIQNGWEHKDINEVERLAASRTQAHRHSISHSRPMSSGFSNGAARLSMHEHYNTTTTDDDSIRSPPSKRHSGLYSPYTTSSQPLRRLQPAPDIRPTTSHRHYATAPSSQTHSKGGHRNGTAMSPPRTPITNHSHAHPRRPATIRTDVQTAEAERDALEALFLMGSPHTSQAQRQHAASQAGSSQASPLRLEFATPRRVTFARSGSGSEMSSTGSSGP